MKAKIAYTLLRDFSDALKESSYQRDLMSEKYTFNALNRSKSGKSTAAIDLEFIQMSNDWIHTLSKSAKLFVLDHIATNLKKYNLLWHFPPTRKSQEQIALKELIDKRILFRTETVGMYLVNPIKVWRGTIFSAVECTKALLRDNIPSPELVRDLRPSDKFLLKTGEDHYNMLMGDAKTPNLLHGNE